VATIKARNPLLKSLQREAAESVRASGWNGSDFEFVELQVEQVITSLLYRPDHNFRFDFFPGNPSHVRFFPSEDAVSSGMVTVPNWQLVLSRFGAWLGYLKREIDTPDPWAAVAESVESFNLGGDANDIDNSRFTPSEQADVIERIEVLRVRLLDSAALSDQDRHVIIARLDYLTEAVGRLGRFDWSSVAVNVVIGLAILGYVDRADVQQFVSLLVGAVQRLLN
jgi:hypothetical protein